VTDRPRDPLSTLLDVVLYAPIGAALHGPEAVEELAVKGRQDVANARVIGKLALDRGRREAAKLTDEVGDRLGDLFVAAARAAGAPMAGADHDTTSSPDEERRTPPGATDRATDGAGPHLTVVPDTAPSVEELAIPDYDNLSASQVVPRLDDLGEDELRAVQEYERAHRGRMTILSRIAQLQAS
jgi:hypothetical protein